MIEIVASRQDQFGYYVTGNFRSYSKFEVIDRAVKTNAAVKWIFNDSVYGIQDWLTEPKQSLSELYAKRAQQLREKYDYIVLFFSGGADSMNILDTFLNNGVRLDEVVSYVNLDATGDKSNHHNGEIYHVAVPTIEAKRHLQPDLLHTVVDTSQMTMDFFNEQSARFDWVYHVNHYLNPNNVSRRDFKLSQPHWRKMFNEGKRVAFVYGSEKPRVKGINGQYWFHFVDMIDPAVPAVTQMSDRAWEFNELFYWTPDQPLIPIKQAHVIKNFLKQANIDTTGTFYSSPASSCVQTTINGKIYNLVMDQLHLLIYPTWKPVPFQRKPPSLIFTNRDTWFFNLPHNDVAKYSWQTGLLHRWQNSPDYLKVDVDDLSKGFKSTLSQQYYIGS